MTNFELLKLSFEVAQSTVAKYMVKRYGTGTVDRINPARVCGSYRGLGRGAFASDLASLARYYNDIRTHQSLDKDAPAVCTENLIRVDGVAESPKLAE
jgi:hypothetical protein